MFETNWNRVGQPETHSVCFAHVGTETSRNESTLSVSPYQSRTRNKKHLRSPRKRTLGSHPPTQYTLLHGSGAVEENKEPTKGWGRKAGVGGEGIAISSIGVERRSFCMERLASTWSHVCEESNDATTKQIGLLIQSISILQSLIGTISSEIQFT